MQHITDIHYPALWMVDEYFIRNADVHVRTIFNTRSPAQLRSLILILKNYSKLAIHRRMYSFVWIFPEVRQSFTYVKNLIAFASSHLTFSIISSSLNIIWKCVEFTDAYKLFVISLLCISRAILLDGKTIIQVGKVNQYSISSKLFEIASISCELWIPNPTWVKKLPKWKNF